MFLISRSSLKSAAPILVAIQVIGLATGSLFALVAVEFDRLGLPDDLIGLTTSLYYLGLFFAAMTFSVVVKHIGRRLGFLSTLLLLIASVLALEGSTSSVIWMISRFVGGYALGGFYLLGDGWITTAASKEDRGALYGLYNMLRLAAVALGPALILVVDNDVAFAIVIGLYMTALIPTVFFAAPDSIEDTSQHRASFDAHIEVLKRFNRPLRISLSVGAYTASFYGLGTAYGLAIDMNKGLIATFVGIIFFAPAVFEVAIGAISDRTNRMGTVAVLASLAVFAAITIVIFTPDQFIVLVTLGAMTCICIVPIYGVALSHMIDMEADPLIAASLCMIAYSVGGAIGPTISGLLMTTMGPSGLYMAIAIFAVVAFWSAMVDLWEMSLVELKRNDGRHR